jgi:ABC-type transporter Mla MlaB component
MKLERSSDDAIRVSGRLDFATVPEFLERFEALPPGAGQRRLDLSAVEHVDSAGVAALLWLRQQDGAGLELVAMPAQARAMAGVAGVAALLEGA